MVEVKGSTYLSLITTSVVPLSKAFISNAQWTADQIVISEQLPGMNACNCVNVITAFMKK